MNLQTSTWHQNINTNINIKSGQYSKCHKQCTNKWSDSAYNSHKWMDMRIKFLKNNMWVLSFTQAVWVQSRARTECNYLATLPKVLISNWDKTDWTDRQSKLIETDHWGNCMKIPVNMSIHEKYKQCIQFLCNILTVLSPLILS